MVNRPVRDGLWCFYVMVRYLLNPMVSELYLSALFWDITCVGKLVVMEVCRFSFCPKKDTALDALDILALYKAWGMHVLLYMIWFVCMALLADHIFIWYWGWQHKYNVRLGCTCLNAGDIP